MKTTMKKALCLMLAFVMVVGWIPSVAHAAPVDKTSTDKVDQAEYAKQKSEMVKQSQRNQVLLSTASGTISTSYIQCRVHSNGGFNIGTSDGDCLLYAYPDGNTSRTLIRIDAVDYIFTDYVTDITYPDSKTAVATAMIDGIEVTQTLTIVKNPNSSTENVVSVRYGCRNTTSEGKTVGIRIMMDTMLGDNDGAPFKIRGESITREVEYRGDNIPKVYQAMDSLNNPSLTATGYFWYSEAEKPDKVQFASWPQIVGSAWDYQVDTNRELTNDSAVAAYFNEKLLNAGSSRSVVTYYGAYDQNAASQYPSFGYDPNTYSQALAEECARYSAYAYQDYKYDASLDVFYNVEDAGKKDVKKNNRSKVLVEYLKKQGYKDIKSENYKEPTENSATYTIARKEVNYNGTVRDLILIVIRGTNKDEWKGNMNVTGTSYDSDQEMHDSFRMGAEQIWARLMRYINTNNGDSKTSNDIDNAMVLITGHSRGGAVGNLLAQELTYNETSKIDSSAIYAYLFAVPNVTAGNTFGMNNVFNFCLTDDFVPSMPLTAWNYGKYGTTFTATATNITDTNFLNRSNSSISKSVDAKDMEDRVSFDAAKTTAVINYVSKNWKNVKQYYTKAPKGNTVVDSLYDFMHDLVAPAAMGNLAVGARLLTFTSSKNPDKNSYTRIANFFTEGAGTRDSVNDTHNMFTYYNALKTGQFAIFASGEAIALNSAAQTTANAANNSLLEQEALIAFANTGSNLEILGWDLADVSTWAGITMNEDGCVTEIDLSYLGLTGGLDLTAFNCLTYVDISGNALESLILPEAETSVLTWLDCSYNNLTALEIAGQPLELLCCSDNYLDADVMEAAASGIALASCRPQNTTEEIVYSVTDCEILRSNVLLNSEIWDTTADPSTWIGVEWEEIDGVYYVSGLNLSDAGLSGELDVSGLEHLYAITCSSNAITSIDASGCDDLAFLNCCDNVISELLISADASLSNLYCTDNYLTEEEIAALGAEMTEIGHQGILEDVSCFSNVEYNTMRTAAELCGDDTQKPGEWFFATWELRDGTYHITKLDLADLEGLTGTLDLSGFAYLEEINCSGTAIETVILPDHMTALNAYAFYDCDDLTAVHLPGALKEIGAYAFYGCSAISEIQFPAGLEIVGESAFSECTALTQVIFPETLAQIGTGAFMNDTQLQAAYFTGNAPACGENAFMFTMVDFTVYYLVGTTGWDDAVWSAYITEEIELFSILTYPVKTQYMIGEELDISGLRLLLLGKDGTYQIITEGFEVECDPLTQPGEHTVAIHYGDNSVTFEVTVQRLSLAYAEISLDRSVYDYTGEPIEPEVTVTYEGTLLVRDVDYILSFEDNIEAGQGRVIVTGIGGYVDSVELYFTIERVNVVSDWTELESEHNYADNSNVTWIYRTESENIISLAITFDERTEFESGYDTLSIYDGNGDRVGTYTGTELAGQTITVPGNSFRLVLNTDGSVNYWGFKVIDVTATSSGHSYEAVVTAPTCTEQGYTTYTCTVCGDSYVSDYVGALGHSFGEWTVVTPATCTENGMESRSCACGETETREIEAVGHVYEAVVTAPTCTEQGYTTYTCTVCGDSYVADYVDALGHSFGEWTVVTPATCTENGVESRSCACGETETREIEVAGHAYEAVVTAPTCTEQGYTTYTCIVCGDSYVADYVDALGHSFGEWTVVTPATCTENGVESRSCACGEIEIREIEATGHIYEDGVCVECGENEPTEPETSEPGTSTKPGWLDWLKELIGGLLNPEKPEETEPTEPEPTVTEPTETEPTEPSKPEENKKPFWKWFFGWILP